LYQSFENLSEDKKQRILDTCILEFAEKGYENASTNTIVKDAEISKGILFHYFGNKKSLFLYVVEYCVQFATTKYRNYSFQPSSDIFDRLIELGMIKLKFYHASPNISMIIMRAFLNTPEDILSELQDKYKQQTNDLMSEIFKDIDSSKFRDGVDPKKGLEMVMLFLEALQEKYAKQYKGREQDLLGDMNKIMEEYKGYIEVLKYGIYANGSV